MSSGEERKDTPDIESVELPFNTMTFNTVSTPLQTPPNRTPSPSKQKSSKWSSLKKNARTLNKSLSGNVRRRTPPSRQVIKNCNCSDAKQCAFDGHCQENNCVYQATISWTDSQTGVVSQKVFIGQSLDAVKNRFTRFESHVAVYTGHCEHTVRKNLDGKAILEFV